MHIDVVQPGCGTREVGGCTCTANKAPFHPAVQASPCRGLLTLLGGTAIPLLRRPPGRAGCLLFVFFPGGAAPLGAGALVRWMARR